MHNISERIRIDQTQELGKGATGNVYMGFWDSQQVAIKTINLEAINNQVTRYLLGCQIAALSELSKQNNPNVVKLFDVAFKGKFCYLVMEPLLGGTLASLISQHGQGMPQQLALQIIKQIVNGYLSIKKEGIVHRDLKPDNVIFKSERQKDVAIIDFGYCTKESVANRPQIYYNVGSPRYMAPQAYKNNFYSEKSDVWALGIVLYEMLVGNTFDAGKSISQSFNDIDKFGIPFPNHIRQPIKRLLQKMLCTTPERRCNSEEVILQIDRLNFSQQEPVTFKRHPMLRNIIVSGYEQPGVLTVSPTHKQTSFEEIKLLQGNKEKISNPSPRQINPLRKSIDNVILERMTNFQIRQAAPRQQPIMDCSLSRQPFELSRNEDHFSRAAVVQEKPNNEKQMAKEAISRNTFLRSTLPSTVRSVRSNFQASKVFFNGQPSQSNHNQNQFIPSTPKQQPNLSFNSSPQQTKNKEIELNPFNHRLQQNDPSILQRDFRSLSGLHQNPKFIKKIIPKEIQKLRQKQTQNIIQTPNKSTDSSTNILLMQNHQRPVESQKSLPLDIRKNRTVLAHNQIFYSPEEGQRRKQERQAVRESTGLRKGVFFGGINAGHPREPMRVPAPWSQMNTVKNNQISTNRQVHFQQLSFQQPLM